MKPNNTKATSNKCSVCGKPLPVNDYGVPVSSVYFVNKWVCHDCKYRKEVVAK